MNRRVLAFVIFAGLHELFLTVAMGGPWDANRQRPPGFQRTLAYLENDLYDYPLPELQSVRNTILHDDLLTGLIAQLKQGGYPPQNWESLGQQQYNSYGAQYAQVQNTFRQTRSDAAGLIQAIEAGRPISTSLLQDPIVKALILVKWQMLNIAEQTYQSVLYANGGTSNSGGGASAQTAPALDSSQPYVQNGSSSSDGAYGAPLGNTDSFDAQWGQPAPKKIVNNPSGRGISSFGGDGQLEVKVKGKIEQNIGENGKIGGAVDIKGKKEVSVGYGPASVKVSEDGVELEGTVLETPKIRGFVDGKLKATLKVGTDRSEQSEFYNGGLPIIKASATVKGEISGDALGPVKGLAVKGTVGGSYTVGSMKLDPMSSRVTNDRLTTTLKAAGTEEFEVKKTPPPVTAESPPKPQKTQQELMDELRLQDAELKKVSAEMVGEKLVSGTLTYRRPANIPNDDWQQLAASLTLGAPGQAQVTGNEVRIYCKDMTEAAWNSLPARLGDGWVIQRNAP